MTGVLYTAGVVGWSIAGWLVCVFALLFVILVALELSYRRKNQYGIPDDMYPISVTEIWRRHDEGQKMQLFIKINKQNLADLITKND